MTCQADVFVGMMFSHPFGSKRNDVCEDLEIQPPVNSPLQIQDVDVTS